MGMKTQFINRSCIKVFTILSLFLGIIACSSNSSDLLSEFSGKWKNEDGSDKVEIELTNQASSLIIDGQTYKGTVEKIDKGSNTVKLNVEMERGRSEVWSLHQEWNDNGSAFKLKLRRNGTTETLLPVGHS
jgi:small nuclear ribonucleoprotein (snRNP)-like protein